ncbi:MAG: VWA domain-containing protein [Alicyclobacillaceae bacterium]|nr:VWA domain-containing protein [Alicyclobacillaceae bacterium]
MVRQILVITDGCSNVGEDPVEAARKARRSGIAVNVVGVVDKGEDGQRGYSEAMSIADAGGGACRIVQPLELSATVQMMTRQTMQLTLAQVVDRELVHVMGKTADDLNPEERTKVAQVVDKLADEVALKLVVAVDTSASMKAKMPTVREAIRDLSLSLQARRGEAEVAVVAFPGKGDENVRLVLPFSRSVDLAGLSDLFVARGGTPTGPAIAYAASLLASPAVRTDANDAVAGPYLPADQYPDVRWTGDSAS